MIRITGSDQYRKPSCRRSSSLLGWTLLFLGMGRMRAREK